ncbi:MAG: hypothetical protein IKQ25_12695, partial [Lachnospiraceae bacterium]|nr:hypothetical protein [Lachnospiraceae bacterium]
MPMPIMGISQPLLSLTVLVSKLNGWVISLSFLSLSSSPEGSSFIGSSVTPMPASAVQPPARMPIIGIGTYYLSTAQAEES